MDASGNLEFESRSRRRAFENRSELNGFMRIADGPATKRSAKVGVSGRVQIVGGGFARLDIKRQRRSAYMACQSRR